MNLHFCKPGDTVLSVAREYGISPTRLLEDNALRDPDRLPEGLCLAVYRSARTYTVRGSDSFEGICRRFRCHPIRLHRFNPGIGETRALYPGQILSLGPADPPHGAIAVNGFADAATSREKLVSALSALSYLTVLGGELICNREIHFPVDREFLSLAGRFGVPALLSLSLPGGSAEIPEAAMRTVPERGYSGILLSMSSDRKIPSNLPALLSSLHSCGLLCGIECDSNQIPECLSNGEKPDFTVLRPEKEDPGFLARCLSLKDSFGEDFLSRLLPVFPDTGAERTENGFVRSLPLDGIPALAYRRNAAILHSESALPSFSYQETRHGRTEEHTVTFEDTDSIRKGLTVIGESGILGVSIRLSPSPGWMLPLVCSLFEILREDYGPGNEKS